MPAPLHTANALHLRQRHARYLRSCRMPGKYGIASETKFDDLARLAAHLLNAPIAAIVLASDTGPLLKSLIGLRWQAGDTLLSACLHAAKSTGPTVIADTHKHAWFRRHLIGTRESPLRFFAAIPVTDGSAKVAGTLVVMDSVPRTLAPDQLDALHAVSRQIMAHHELGCRHSTLRALAAHQENIKEQERKRIAQDIHDELGQNLMSLKLDLLRIQENVSATALARECASQIQSALHHLDNTICSVRHIINDLRPPVLTLGIYAAVQWQLEKFRRSTQLHCELDAHPLQWQGLLSDTQTEILFRLLQEALTNIARHANATRVLVRLDRNQFGLQMCISDDGIGIDSRVIKKHASFGLLGMRERLHELNGALHIVSTPGQGTALTIDIPLQDIPRTDLH